MSLETDNVFGDDGGASQLGTMTGDVSSGYNVTLVVGVDVTTPPTDGRLFGDGCETATPVVAARLG